MQRKLSRFICTYLVPGILILIFGSCALILIAVFLDAETVYVDRPQQQQLSRQIDLAKFLLIPDGANVPKEAPWPTPAPSNLITNRSLLEDSQLASHSITTNFSFSPGLGNLMFQYASMLGIARANNATLIVPDNIFLRRAFHLEHAQMVEFHLWYRLAKTYRRLTVSDCCRHYPQTQLLNLTAPASERKQMVLGYLQSFKYFEAIRDEIREAFTFLPEITKLAQAHLNKALQRQYGSAFIPMERLLVGVHVRRGPDMTWNTRNLAHGHAAASAEYFLKAMALFRRKYNSNQDNFETVSSTDSPVHHGTPNITFVVVSDGQYWAKKHLAADDVSFVSSEVREVDMRILTLCNHTIMSQGTFSWWAAYLTGGDVIFNGAWPRKGSKMDKMLNRNDYFPSEWMPLYA